MIRSLSAAVSGLRNHQNKLDVVGNNIANVNTVGYKYNTALFQDIFSQTVRGATAPQPGQGGINPVQVGLGMGLSSSTPIHTQGALTSTGRESDLAIEGRGFFVVSDGAQNYFTRDGSFVRDSSGVLVNANGMTLMGWVPVLNDDGEEVIDTSQPLSRINIPLGEDTIAKATSMMDFAGNLNAVLGRPSNLVIDANSGINKVLASGLQFGDYEIITEEMAGGVDYSVTALQQFVQHEDLNSWLDGADPDVDPSNINASMLLEVVSKDGDLVTFRLTSHQYNKDGSYTKPESITFSVDTEADNETGDQVIGGLTFSAGLIGGTAGSGANYTVGDKVVFDVKAEAVAGDDLVRVGYDSPAAAGYDINAEWVFDDEAINDNTTVLRFFTLDSRGNVYDGFTTLGVDEIGDSTYPHTTFSFMLENESAYGYTAYAYDSLGNQHFLDIVFQKTDINTWEYTISHPDPNITLNGATGILEFNASGRLRETSTINELFFDPNNGADMVEFTPDFSIVTQLVADSNVIARRQDGFAAGELVAFEIQATGVVSGTYTNGMIKALGQVAMASFINPEGLFKIGANLYDVSANSGDARIGLPGDQGRGLIQARSLEMSNVDLANEFTEMITTSRAFQANSRVISTSDEVLQELVNIKR